MNRVGTDGNGLAYAGDSAIIDPLGETLVTAGAGRDGALADVDPAVVAKVRADFPFLRDRRP